VIRQGELYWLDLGVPFGSEPGYRRPYVVVQSDAFNRGSIRTAVMCAVTTSLRLGRAPGNILLDAGEGNLLRASVVNVSQVYTVDQARLDAPIGQLSPRRIRQVVAGLRVVTEIVAPG
jgi:mRNA interferase MazF